MSTHGASVSFEVRKGELDNYRFVEASELEDSALQDGQVLLALDTFAFTANNITYILMGDYASYWSFFPTEEGWGRPPVWGFADVVASKVPEIQVGERIYGFYPLATHVVLQPARVDDKSFIDGVDYRQELAPIYNRYQRTGGDPNYDPEAEHVTSLLRPLFTTAFLLDDYQADNDFFGAEAVVLTSASSKTSLGTAFLLRENRASRRPYELIGLTSPGNVAFVEGLGCYDRVLPYDDVETLPEDSTLALVDVAGNAKVRTAIHNRFRDNLKCSSQVGASHWHSAAPPLELPGPPQTPFFAPAQLEKRFADWGRDGFNQKLDVAWASFVPFFEDRVEVQEARGREAVEKAYHQMLGGKVSPSTAYMLSLLD